MPGIKSGRAVDEKTAATIAPGSPIADVLLRLGEPDSVSADGRGLVYRFSRLWAVALFGGYGAGYAAPVEYGEALVVTLDESHRVVTAERRGGGVGRPRPGDALVFHAPAGSGGAFVPGDEAALATWVGRWWETRRAPNGE